MIILLWLLVGSIAYGMILSAFTKEFPHFNSIGVAVLAGVLGPFGLVAAFLFCMVVGRWGFMLKPYTYDERLAKFMAQYPNLGKEYFDEHDA